MTTRAKAWIASPRYDLPLLSLAPFLGIVVTLLAFAVDPVILGAIILFGLGMPHYFSTYTFFFGDENFEYYKTRRILFFAGPLVIAFLLTASLALKLFFLVAVIVDSWNVYHVSRQSIGILGVYRHLGGGNNLVEKLPANFALLGIGAGLYTIHVDKQQSFMYYISLISPDLAPVIGPLLLICGGVALVVLLARMTSRAVAPSPAELLFLVGSLVLFLPFVFLEDRSMASGAMLSGHFVQYLGLLWLLNVRKYRGAPEGSARQRALSWISSSWLRILGLLLFLVLSATAVDRFVHFTNAVAAHTWLLNMVVLLHFYYDGLFWAFKRPEVRSSIAPYLVSPDRRLEPEAPTAARSAVA